MKKEIPKLASDRIDIKEDAGLGFKVIRAETFVLNVELEPGSCCR